jgi:Ni/Fe-hydrogenase subunit HybB-like protein
MMTIKPTTFPEQLTLSFRKQDALIAILAFLTLIGVAAGVGRLFTGLQGSTGLSDHYAWGIWIGFDFSLIAFAGTGFTLAALVHIFHVKRLAPAVRPAILAGLLGYCTVLALLVLDLGRPDRFYNFIIFWNIHSPLFEVSWCILTYTTVLVIEVSPCCLEKANCTRLCSLVKKFMVPVTILGVTLSTLHQSTLGTLYLNMPHRLNALWYSPLLPVMFFISAVMAGLAMAIIVYKAAMRVKAQPEQGRVVTGLGWGIVAVGLLYLLVKLGEWALAGELPLLLAFDSMSWLALAEIGACFLLPLLLWVIPAVRRSTVGQWTVPLLVLLGVLMNRFNATMFAQLIPPGTSYTPHILEWLSTIGLLAGMVLVWLLAVKYLPIGEEETSAH